MNAPMRARRQPPADSTAIRSLGVRVILAVALVALAGLGLVAGALLGYWVFMDDDARFAFREWGDNGGRVLLGIVVAEAAAVALWLLLLRWSRRWPRSGSSERNRVDRGP